MINAKHLVSDNKSYPGYIRWSRADATEPEEGLFLSSGEQVCVLGPRTDLKTVLSAPKVRGSLEQQSEPLLVDFDIVHCYLQTREIEGISAGALPNLDPFLGLIPPQVEEEFRRLPSGSVSFVGIGFRLHGKPEFRLVLGAADDTLALEIVRIMQKGLEQAKSLQDPLKNRLLPALTEDVRQQVGEFIDAVAEGSVVRREFKQLTLVVPLGKDLSALQRLTALGAQRNLNISDHWFEALNEVRTAEKLKDPKERHKRIVEAFYNFHDVDGKILPAAICDKEGKPLLSWRVKILANLGYEKLYEEFHLDEPWDSPHNRTLLDKMPQIYRDERVEDKTRTSLQVFTGPFTPFSDRPLKLIGIKDGTSNVILAVETPSAKAVPWTKPEDLTFVRDDPASVLGELPPEGIRAVMFDGRSVILPTTLSDEEWRRLIMHSDGQVMVIP